MGLDLTILPLNRCESITASMIFARDSIQFVRDYRIFGQIADIHGKSKFPEGELEVIVRPLALPEKTEVGLYEEEGLTFTSTDNYEDKLTYALAQEMRKLKLTEDSSPWNKAILAYINALPVDVPIILKWH